jgi:16S rRNA (guanine966-N2)-methyltransferase
MRIIAGQYKGRRLASPTWAGLRPTSDRLKGTLFNILGAAVDGARVLDGFAGAGALGLEALSRGAATATFVDIAPRALALVEANLRHCGITGPYVIIRDSFVGATRRLPADQRFDLVLLDPPYEYDDLSEALAAAGGCLSPAGILVLEHARRRAVPGQEAALVRYRTVTAGDSALSFYRPAGEAVRTPVEET